MADTILGVLGLLAGIINILAAILFTWIAVTVGAKDGRRIFSAIEAVLAVLKRVPQGAEFTGVSTNADGTVTANFTMHISGRAPTHVTAKGNLADVSTERRDESG